jgi:broad specificity phosphatase PhoE
MQRVANGVLRRVVQDWGDFDLVVTSPMTRAIETSLLCMEGLDSPLPVILPLVTERGTSACDRGSPQGVLEERFPELNFAPLRDRVREEWWGVTDASRGYGDAWWAEEEIRYSGGGLSPDYGRHFALISARAVKLAEYLSGRPEQRIIVFGHGGIFNALLGKVFRNCEVGRYAWPPTSYPPPPQETWKDADPRGSIHARPAAASESASASKPKL